MDAIVRCSVVVPVYNSHDCIEELARCIDEVLNTIQCPYELLLINDYSRDRSWQVIKDLSRRFRTVRGISFRKNFGQDNALMAGIRMANGEYIITMDDDLQHDPAYIPQLLAEIEKGFDVVYARYNRKKQKPWKNFGSWLNSKLAQFVIRKPADVYLSPYKIVRAGVAKEICNYEGPYPYIDGLLFRRTASFSQIDIEHHKRFSGTSTYTFWKSIRVWSYLATNFSIVPLRIASLLGIAAAVSGIAMGIVFSIHRMQHPEYPAGWASLMVSLLIFSGGQLISIGVAGEYIGRLYLNINRQPQYSIAETTEQQ